MKMLAPLTSLVALLTAALLVGCGTEPTQTASDQASDSPPAIVETDGAHDHPSEGPHGGDLIELGNEEYHGELLHPHSDDGGGENVVAIFILDGSAKNVVPIEATEVTLNLVHDGKPAQFQLAASPEEGEHEGKSSRFVSSDAGLLAHFGEEEIDGRLAVTINGKAYNGELHHHHDGHEHGDDHAHSHSGDDALIWRRDVERAGYAIRLGHHGEHLHAGEEVEPAIGITRDGKPVSDAKVFNTLVAEDEETIAAKEAATIYEPPTAEEPAHYAQGGLTIPADAKRIIIRYRILLPADAGEVTYDVPVDVE
jgi:hypothetical protein